MLPLPHSPQQSGLIFAPQVEAKANETRDALEALLQGKTGGGKVQSQVG